MKAQLVEEQPKFYVMSDGKGQFRVPKAGLSDALHEKIRAMGGGMAEGGKVGRLTDVMHAKESPEARAERKRREYEEETGDVQAAPQQPVEPKAPAPELADAREARKRSEYEEETGDERDYYVRPKAKKEPEPSLYSRAANVARRVSEMLPASLMGTAQAATKRAHGGSIPGYAEGGGVEDAGQQPVAAVMASGEVIQLPPRRESPRTVYDTTTGQPIGMGGTGGGGGGSGGGMPDMPPSPSSGAGGGTSLAESSGAGGGPGAIRTVNRGSGGATGGPSGNQAPQHEAIQPRAVRPSLQLPPGVRPAGQQRSELPAPAPEAAARPRGTGAQAPSGPSGLETAKRAEIGAAETAYGAQREVARAEAAAAKAHADAMEASQLERKADVETARQETNRARVRLQAAQEEVNRVDTTVDPGRFWASRTTGQKILGILGLALGAIGTGPDGINRAAAMLQQSIDRDLDAQKAEHTLRLKKGAQALEGAQNFYSMAYKATGDELAAKDAGRALALNAVVARGQQMIAATKDPLAKARLAEVLAAVERQGAVDSQKAEQQTFENRIKARHAAVEEELAGKKGGASPDQAKVVTEIEEREKNIQSNARELTALIKTYGTQEKIAPGIEARMNQLRSALIVDSAKMKDPGGVVREPDEEREGRAMGFEPSFWQRSDNAIAGIEAFANGAAKRRAEAYAARGMRPPGGP